jgi:hypothetical protein|tara:strand:+ start:1337 stop:1528 length:192 start_codon:yes stop_codon:yes gene_type:complete
MPVNPSNKRRRAAASTANDKITINGVEYGVGAKAGNAPRIGKSLHSFLLLYQTEKNCGCKTFA